MLTLKRGRLVTCIVIVKWYWPIPSNMAESSRDLVLVALGLVPTSEMSASLNWRNAGNGPSTGVSVPSAAMRLTSTTLLGTSMVVVTGKSISIVRSAIADTVAVFLKGCLIGLS